ncbi:MAG: 16S rRNA (uracil(1498)-N(3))-methyltransferase [Ignavibacteria bacterium]|nr:16S rRNA (uracil(1498)-N(3))-methyltransferase [Ignavibacteria bacterium]
MEYYCISVEKINIETNEINVEGDDYRHLSKVLRKKVGDTLIITDGRLNIYECRIVSIDTKKIICRIEEKI